MTVPVPRHLTPAIRHPSWRRKETVGDADFLVVARKPEKVMDYFSTMREVLS